MKRKPKHTNLPEASRVIKIIVDHFIRIFLEGSELFVGYMRDVCTRNTLAVRVLIDP